MKNPGKADDPKLIRHIEKYLGPIESGRKMNTQPVSVVKITDRPQEGVDTFVTLGLSSFPLQQRGGGSALRQELLFSAWATEDDEPTIALIMAIVSDILESGTSLDCGQVLGPAGPILDGATAEALYTISPVYFDDGLQDFEGFEDPLVFVWLVPILAAEAVFIAKKGTSEFEDLLEDQNPDLLDVTRKAVRLR